MPINLKYGQKAVERGFITPQRLQQVLSKQRQLGEQGKKVSVRMILEKAKLLSTVQLAQIDADLNIKVVKKQTGRFTAPQPGPDLEPQPLMPPSMKATPVRSAPQAPVGAQNFGGEAVPEFAGMTGANPDVTVFEPPPADMQDRIRAERDKAKALAKAKQEADAAEFFQQNDPNPFGDPFAASGEMAPEPFGGDMQPAAEMAPEPFSSDMQPVAEMQPEAAPDEGGFAQAPMADDDGLSPEPMGGEGMAELDRMDSSPKLTSIAAEFTGFASPDEEELPALDAGFDAEPAPMQQRPMAPQRPLPPRGPSYAPPQPTHADLAPAGGEFEGFGNDIMSPDQLESAPPVSGTKPLGSGTMERTMFSPPPAGFGGREKTGGMDRTMFSPKPAGFGAEQPPAEESQQAWGEQPAGAAFDDSPSESEATVFSPPPEGVARGPAAKKPAGRQGAADFADISLPMGKRMDDIPTAPATGDDVHPLRRNVTTSQKGSQQMRPPSQGVPALGGVSDELPSDDGAMMELQETSPVMQPKSRGGKSSDRAAGPEPEPKGKFAPGKKRGDKSDRGDRAEPEERRGPPPGSLAATGHHKSKSPRVLLLFSFLLIIAVTVLVLPVYLTDIPQVKALRDHERAKPIYDYVADTIQEINKQFRKLVGTDEKPGPGGKGVTPSNAPTANEAGASDNTQPPANGG